MERSPLFRVQRLGVEVDSLGGQPLIDVFEVRDREADVNVTHIILAHLHGFAGGDQLEHLDGKIPNYLCNGKP